MVRIDGHAAGHFEGGVTAISCEVRQEMLRRATWLGAKDRLIVQLWVKGNLTLREMAGVIGLPAGSISRRLARIRQRMMDRQVTALLDPHGTLPEEIRAVGLEYFLAGMRTGEIADRHRVPVAQVRKMIHFIEGWQKGRVGVR